MNKRRLAALLTVCLLAGGLAGCGEAEPEATPEPTPIPVATPRPYVEPTGLSLGYSSAGSLHPMKAADQGSLDVDSLVYDSLFQPDAAFQPQPVLAESARQAEGGYSWTVRLREGAFFSDGTTLTAEHAAASLRAARSSTRYRSRLSGVTGVRAEDERTVVITLSRPNGALPALLDVPIFLEREDGGLPLGTGPYAFLSGEDGMSLHYNPAWWRGEEPVFQNIALVPFDTLENRAADFGSGEVTVVTTDYNSAGAPTWPGTYETYDYPTSVMLYVGFNANGDKRVCHDRLVRLALSRCFDRDEIVNVLMAGHAQASALPVPRGTPGDGEAEEARLRRDDAGCAAAFEEAGWTKNADGALVRRRRAMSLTLLVNRDSAVKQAIAASIAQSLEAQGIAVTVSILDWEGYTAALASGDFDLYLGEVRLPGDFDWSALVNSGSLNYGGYYSEELDAALNAWRAAEGSDRTGAAEALWGQFAQEAPFAPLCFKQNSLLARWGMAGSYAPTQDHPFNGIENWTTTGE